MSAGEPKTAPPASKSVRSKLPAGVVDASFASLATFAAGLVAVNIFGGHDLGIYAVFFAAFTFGQLVAYQLIYVPAEIVAVGEQGTQRLTIFADSIRIGFVPSLLGASLVLVASISTAPLSSFPLTIGLTVTVFAATLLSPTQDHVRRTLHIADRSWHAAAMSVTQFVVTVGTIGILLAADVAVPWIHFGALTAANFVSLSLGLVLVARDRHHAKAHVQLSFGELTDDGRWLLLQAAVPAGAAFVTANIITYLAGPVAMGYAEGARIVAQPIVVLAAGLIYPLRPRAMEAALTRNRPASVRVERAYVALVAMGGLIYLPLVSGAWAWNPMQYLVPVAYVVPGLVAAAVLANIVLASVFLLLNEMMAAGKGRTLAFWNTVAGVVRILIATSAAVIGPFARPVSEGVGELPVIGGLLNQHRKIYRTNSGTDDAG